MGASQPNSQLIIKGTTYNINGRLVKAMILVKFDIDIPVDMLELTSTKPIVITRSRSMTSIILVTIDWLLLRYDLTESL